MYEKYYNLPYEYVVEAYLIGLRMNQLRLHEQERPLGLMMSIQANLNRDPKKRSKPYTAENFYLYQPQDEKDIPKQRYGAAAMALIEQKQFPAWGLFCFKELAAAASGPPPAVLGFIGDNAMLLGPEKTPTGYKGMLIATEEASNQIIDVQSPCGLKMKMLVPYISTKIEAKEVIGLHCW